MTVTISEGTSTLRLPYLSMSQPAMGPSSPPSARAMEKIRLVWAWVMSSWLRMGSTSTPNPRKKMPLAKKDITEVMATIHQP